MATVGQPMDDSYAERARKAAAAPKSRNNVKNSASQHVPEPVGVPSSSSSATLDSSPALSAAQTATTSLAPPLSINMSSTFSEQASPVRTSPRNAWSERGSLKTPQKAQATTTLVVPHANSDNLSMKPDTLTSVRTDDGGHIPTKVGQMPSSRAKSDPFVVNYNHVAPTLADAQNWPQVGEASATASSPRHARPSPSSVSPLNIVSGSQTPAHPVSEGEADQSGGDKKKWIAIPAKELQAAVDEVERRRTPSSKGHSPHLNGRGRRIDDAQSSHGARETGSSAALGNTRHDRTSSLGVPSSSSSRRVSPLHLTASLPANSNEPTLNPSVSSLVAPDHAALQTDHSFYAQPSGSGSGNHSSSSVSIRYSPWQTPTFTPYHSATQMYQAHSRGAAKGGNGTQRRQRRRRRPTPREAPPLAGFRANAVVILRAEDHPLLVNLNGGQDVALDLSPRPPLSPKSKPRTRSSWWSLGVSSKHVERWHKRDSSLLSPAQTGHDLASVTAHNFLSSEEISTPSDEETLQGVSSRGAALAVELADAPYVPNGMTPGSGPSGLDIDLAIRTPVSSMQVQPGVDLFVPHMPSPSSVGHRADWVSRGDGSIGASNAQLSHSTVNHSPHPTESRPFYGGGDDRGRGRWRGDDRGPRGRGRGFPSRGRGFRGMGNARPFNPAFSQPQGQSAYPGGHYPSTTLYIPEPPLQPHYYPYPSPVAPPSFTPYPAAPVPTESSSVSVGKPPSPRPLTHLSFHMEDTRFRLLGQIEYYFSHENVAKDVYLRERMDSKGWVPIQVLQSFPRIQSLRVSDDMIRETLQWSQFVEVRQSHVRMAHDEWRHYVLPTASESTVPDAPHWYPQPVYPPYMGGIPPPFYGYPPPPFPYYPPIQPEESYSFSNGIAEHILRRPEEKSGGNGAQESGTSGGNSIHSTPNKVDGEELETSEDDVVFVIGDPSPMVRPSPGPAESK
ncbi:hypothetical protein PIIN_04970 [Serendipita indica DSM 11827]|uniref:HTH La-type RNA-binding domain-containing protein n=1 Tax=Serendipita indica (strain DSM 11827) TaxID=1109443 RepID=G4TI94_SERID|nr:hypothetical protein PIIN_04970 [Serendipita indica DSM 11827]